MRVPRTLFLLPLTFLALVVPTFLSGCIPVDQQSQDVNNNFSLSQNLTKLEDIKTSFYTKTLKKWKEKNAEFVQNAEILSKEVNLLTGHSGWPSFLEIIKSYNSLIYVEGPEAAQKKIAVSLSAWNTKWNADGEKFYQKHVDLVGRSQELEKQRITLWSENDVMYQKYWDDFKKVVSSFWDGMMASNPDNIENNLMLRKITLDSFAKMKKTQIEQDRVFRQIYWLNPEDGLFRRKLPREDLEKLFGP